MPKASPRTFTISEQASIVLLLAWGRTLEEHGLTFKDWLDKL